MVEQVAQRAVVEDHDLAQVRLYRAKVLYKGSVPERTMLPIETAREILSVALEPIDYGVGVLLDGGGKDHQVVPLAHLDSRHH